MAKDRKKPRGSLGVIRMTPDGSSFLALELPRSKEGIEDFIVNSLLRTTTWGKKRPVVLAGRPRRNHENSLDYTIDTTVGTQFLELMEVAPLDRMMSRYPNEPMMQRAGDRADWVWSKMMKKAGRYGNRADSRIHLLLYSTHTPFDLSPSAMKLLSLWCAKLRSHPFASVAFVAMYGDGSAQLSPIHPVRIPRGMNEQDLRDEEYFLPELSQAQISPDGSTWYTRLPKGFFDGD